MEQQWTLGFRRMRIGGSVFAELPKRLSKGHDVTLLLKEIDAEPKHPYILWAAKYEKECMNIMEKQNPIKETIENDIPIVVDAQYLLKKKNLKRLTIQPIFSRTEEDMMKELRSLGDQMLKAKTDHTLAKYKLLEIKKKN